MKDGKHYKTAHPSSVLGDPNTARANGWDFVAFIPNKGDGLHLYRRTPFLLRFIRAALAKVSP